MDKEKVIELLNKDLQDEHGAIIQYLTPVSYTHLTLPTTPYV